MKTIRTETEVNRNKIEQARNRINADFYGDRVLEIVAERILKEWDEIEEQEPERWDGQE